MPLLVIAGQTPRSPRVKLRCSQFAALAMLTIIALPAKADTKQILMVVPNAMKRTAINMVTFRNRQTAIMQWVDLAACFADAETTRRSINRGSALHR